MIERDVLIEKTNHVQNCLKRIHETLKGDVNSIQNLDVQDIVTLNLQRAIQKVIDMASYIVSRERHWIPQSPKDLFIILEKSQIIEHSLSLKMQKMIGFRNIALHCYQAIDPDILISILKHHLQDLVDFYTAVIEKTRLL